MADFAPFSDFEGAADQFFARLGENLDGDAIGNLLVLDEKAHEIKIGLRGGGKADLDFLEAHGDQRVEHAHLALMAHGLDERLVAVAQIDGAPDGRFGDGAARPLPVGQGNLGVGRYFSCGEIIMVFVS